MMPARRVLREILCRIAGANQQNSHSVTAGKGSNLWARSFLICTNPAALTRLLKCPDAFNIIYIMRTLIAEGEKQPPSVNQLVIQPATSPGRLNEHTYREIRHLRNIVFAKRIKQML